MLSAHKYIPPVMEIVAEMPETRVEGFLAAGHAAAITGWGIFESFVEKHGIPVVVAGFEPLDILAGLARLVELVRDRTPRVVNMFPRCVTKEGNLVAQRELWSVFDPVGGRWRGIAHVPNGNLRLRDEWAHVDARRRFSDRPHRPLGLRAAHAVRQLHLRRHHVGHQVARRLHALREGVRARQAGRRLHGLLRRDLQDLAPVRRDPQPRRCAVKSVLAVSEERVTLKHGAGGRAMRMLIEEVFLRDMPETAALIGPEKMDDGAVLPLGNQFLVLTTDSHVVQPIFFPGGDIGRLSVSGTVNDLAMMGATEPLALTCAAVLEEGFSRADLERIQESIRLTCREAGASVVTGDTKVMGRGEIDGIILNTTGVALTDRVIPDSGLRPGDRIVVTGSIGDHGFAILAIRHGLDLVGDLVSDVAPINGLIREAIRAAGNSITAMKDPTRGGLSSALHEMAGKAGVGIVLEEGRGACVRGRAGGGGPARHRPASRGQRGQGGLRSSPGGCRPRCSKPCTRTRSGATPRSSAPVSTRGRATSSSTPGSAAGSWRNPRASSCRAYADRPASRRRPLLAPGAGP